MMFPKVPPNQEPYRAHPNEINAIYMDYLNRGAFYINDGHGPEPIEEWKKRRIAEWEADGTAYHP